MGVEPTSSAWEADILPMNYARTVTFFIIYLFAREFNIAAHKVYSHSSFSDN